MRCLIYLLATALCLVWAACTQGPDIAGHSGGTDETGNAFTGVTGRVVGTGGRPATVIFHPETSPGPDARNSGTVTVRTDSNGVYLDSSLAPGRYTIEIRGADSQAALSRCTVPALDTLVQVGSDTLKPCGGVQGWLTVNQNQLPDSFGVFDVVIWNMNIARPVQSQGYFLINSLPEGDYRIRIQPRSPGLAMFDTSDVHVSAGRVTPLDIVNLDDRIRVTGGPGFAADTLAVRALLDSNRLPGLVADVIWVIQGRVAYVKIQGDLNVIPDDVARLDHLEYLGLIGTNGSFGSLRVSDSLGLLDSLKVLEITGQRLTRVPPAIAGLRSLRELDLSQNRIDSLPAFLFTLSGLSSLRVGGNSLDVIPPGIQNLGNLVALDLQNNQLAALPPELGQLTGLSLLYLNINRLDSLPGSLGRLRLLKEFSLRENRLVMLPDSLTRLTCLVDVTNNQLCAVPANVAAWLDAHHRRYLDIADTTRWQDSQCR